MNTFFKRGGSFIIYIEKYYTTMYQTITSDGTVGTILEPAGCYPVDGLVYGKSGKWYIDGESGTYVCGSEKV